MATHAGNEGTVHVGTAAIAEVRSWSITETVRTIDDTVMGDTYASFKAGVTEWEGSLSCYWDETDATGQGALTLGSTVTLNVYPEGNASSDVYYSGQALISGLTKSGSHDGMVEANFEFKGVGVLSELTKT